MSAPPETVPAATLILFRTAEPGPPELLMLERSPDLAFAGGAMVFPGGRIEPGDLALAGGDEEDAARVAAIRETIEEAGIAVGLDPAPDAAGLAWLRAGLSAGEAFADLLSRRGLVRRPEALTAFARWRPNFRQARNYDTRFFVAQAPAFTRVEADGRECVAALWTTAADLLAEGRPIIFPTRRNLERLARFASYDEAVADARLYPIRTITPRVERREDGEWIVIPDDLGYPVTAEPLATARRGEPVA